MVKAISTAGGPGWLDDLHRRFYAPLSNLYLHASPTALARQMDMRSNRLRPTANRMWSARSAVNMSDAMVALVAQQLAADRRGAELFDSYFTLHYSRSLPPQTYLVLQLVRGKLSVRSVMQIWSLVRQTASMKRDGPIGSDQLDKLYAEATAIFGGEENPAITSLVAEAKASILSP